MKKPESEMRRWDVLAKHVKDNGWTSGIEVGVWKGATFFHLLDNCPKLHLIGVDRWQGDETEFDQDREIGRSCSHTQREMDQHREAVMGKAEGYPRATIYHTDSANAVNFVEDGSVDFVFIDANHSTESVLEDIRLWKPKIKPGGILLGHDEQWPSVRRALAASFDEWNVYPDNVWSVEC